MIYNVVDESEHGILLPDGAVMTNVFVPGKEKLVQMSSVPTDGGEPFSCCTNPCSFNDVYIMNQSVDVREACTLSLPRTTRCTQLGAWNIMMRK